MLSVPRNADQESILVTPSLNIFKQIRLNVRKFLAIYFWVIPVIFIGLINFFVLPGQISFDGHLYLASAKSIFSEDFSSYYHLMREPLYPIFIKIFINLGGLKLLFFAQNTLLVISTIIISNIFRKTNDLSNLQLIIGSTVGFLTVRGYGSSILQQTLIIFLFSCYISILRRYKEQKSFSENFKIIIIIALALNLFVVLGFVMIFTMFALSFEFRQFQKFLTVSLISAVLILPWIIYKQTAETEKQKFISTNVTQFLISQNSSLGEKRLQDLLQSGLATVGLAPEINTQPMPSNFEAGIYGMPIFNSKENCTQISPGFDPIVEYVEDLESHTSCLSNASRLMNNSLSIAGRTIYQISNLYFVSFLLLGFIGYFKKYKYMVYASIAFIAPYVVAGYGISRFGAPLYVIAPFTLLLIWNRRHTRATLMNNELTQ